MNPTVRATGEEFAALMQRYGLRTNAGARIAAPLLRVSPATIQSYHTRGLSRNYLDLLEIRLKNRQRRKAAGVNGRLLLEGKPGEEVQRGDFPHS